MKNFVIVLSILVYPLAWLSYWHGINDLDDFIMSIISLITYCTLVWWMAMERKGG